MFFCHSFMSVCAGIENILHSLSISLLETGSNLSKGDYFTSAMKSSRSCLVNILNSINSCHLYKDNFCYFWISQLKFATHEERSLALRLTFYFTQSWILSMYLLRRAAFHLDYSGLISCQRSITTRLKAGSLMLLAISKNYYSATCQKESYWIFDDFCICPLRCLLTLPICNNIWGNYNDFSYLLIAYSSIFKVPDTSFTNLIHPYRFEILNPRYCSLNFIRLPDKMQYWVVPEQLYPCNTSLSPLSSDQFDRSFNVAE